MDPSRNAALHNAKSQSLNTTRPTSTPDTPSSEDMPAPPAYHMVVDPNMSVPHIRSPYEVDDEKDEDEEAQEINIIAATQIRGNGNIISIAQHDSMRLANLIAFMVNAARQPEPASPTSTQTRQQQGQTLPSMAALSDSASKRPFPKINITVNCGATIIGDRNIVGPGLGDIARQMQSAQRNQAMHFQQQQSQESQAQCQGQAAQSKPSVQSQRETLYQAQQTTAQNHGVYFGGPTPPMSRSPSAQSEEGVRGKRKADDAGREEFGKRRR